MSLELETQIRGYVEFFDATLESVAVESLVEGQAKLVPSRPSRRRDSLMAVAAAAFVLLVVGGGAWLQGNRDVRSESPAQMASTAPTQPVTARPSSQPDPPSTTSSLLETEPPNDLTDLLATVPVDFQDGWTQLSMLESGLTGARLERIFPWDDRLVGIGSDPATGLGTVWTSDDGLHWERSGDVYKDTGTDTVLSVPFPPLRWMSVKVGGPGLVAVDKPGSVGAEVWVGELSESGLTWKNTASIPGACCFVDIAATDDLFVVVSEQVNHQEGNPGVWTSTDAYAWQRVLPENLPFGDASHGLGFVEASGPGFVGRGWGVKSLYVSINGTEWFRPQDFATMHPEAVRESLISLGHTDYGRLCRGKENGDWVCGVGTNTTVTSVATVDGRSVAINSGEFDPLTGWAIRGGLTLLGLSTDGRTWTWIPPTPGIAIPLQAIEVVAWRDQIIVLTSDTVNGAIWAWTPQPGGYPP